MIYFYPVYALIYLFPCSELEDSVAEAQRRTKQIPPPLPSKDVLKSFSQTNNRLLILVFNLVFSEFNKTIDLLFSNEIVEAP